MSNNPDHPQAKSIRAKLINLANSSNVSVQQVQTLFLLERATVRLMEDKDLAKHMIFKGGYILVRVYQSPRYTTDIDALLQGMSIQSAESKIAEAMSKDLNDAVWFKFMESVDTKTQGNYLGRSLIFRGGIGDPPNDLKKAQIITLDLGIGDAVTPAPMQLMTNLTLGEGHISWLVYPLETIISEKLHALVELGSINSRSKDIFDLQLLLPQVTDRNVLQRALAETFAHRGTELPTSIANKIRNIDLSILKKGWKSAVNPLINPPIFEESYEKIVGHLDRLAL